MAPTLTRLVAVWVQKKKILSPAKLQHAISGQEDTTTWSEKLKNEKHVNLCRLSVLLRSKKKLNQLTTVWEDVY